MAWWVLLGTSGFSSAAKLNRTVLVCVRACVCAPARPLCPRVDIAHRYIAELTFGELLPGTVLHTASEVIQAQLSEVLEASIVGLVRVRAPPPPPAGVMVVFVEVSAEVIDSIPGGDATLAAVLRSLVAKKELVVQLCHPDGLSCQLYYARRVWVGTTPVDATDRYGVALGCSHRVQCQDGTRAPFPWMTQQQVEQWPGEPASGK